MRISVIIFLLSLYSVCSIAQEKTTKDFPKNAETKKVIEQVAGSWKLQQIVDDAKKSDVTTEERKTQTNKQNEASGGTTIKDQSANAMEMIELNPNGRYKLNNSTTAVDSGSYRINEEHGILYMESDSDDITPTEWKLSYNNEQLTLAGREGAANSKYKYVYKKVKEKLSTN